MYAAVLFLGCARQRDSALVSSCVLASSFGSVSLCDGGRQLTEWPGWVQGVKLVYRPVRILACRLNVVIPAYYIKSDHLHATHKCCQHAVLCLRRCVPHICCNEQFMSSTCPDVCMLQNQINILLGSASRPIMSVERGVSYRERAAGCYSTLPFSLALASPSVALCEPIREQT